MPDVMFSAAARTSHFGLPITQLFPCSRQHQLMRARIFGV